MDTYTFHNLVITEDTSGVEPFEPSNDSMPHDEYLLAEQLQEEAVRQEEENRAFLALPAAKRRVAIAKDVLKWLAAGKLKAQTGTYLKGTYWVDSQGVAVTELYDGYDLRRDIERVVGEIEPDRVDGGSCVACALGGIFACAVERQGGYRNPDDPDELVWNASQEQMHEYLAPHFDQGQLRMIESAFESGDFFDDRTDPAILRACIKFNAGLDREGLDSNERMARIMRNIIKHRGTFVPTDRPRVARVARVARRSR